MKDIFVNPAMSLLGWGLVLAVVVVGIMLLIDAIKDGVCILRERIKLRNRFGKPPVAKCFCVECRYWTQRTKATNNTHAGGYCGVIDRYTPDYGYCYEGWKMTAIDILRRKEKEKGKEDEE